MHDSQVTRTTPRPKSRVSLMGSASPEHHPEVHMCWPACLDKTAKSSSLKLWVDNIIFNHSGERAPWLAAKLLIFTSQSLLIVLDEQCLCHRQQTPEISGSLMPFPWSQISHEGEKKTHNIQTRKIIHILWLAWKDFLKKGRETSLFILRFLWRLYKTVKVNDGDSCMITSGKEQEKTGTVNINSAQFLKTDELSVL